MLFDAAIITILAGAAWLFIRRLVKGSLPLTIGKLDLKLPGVFILAFSLQFLLIPLALQFDWAQTLFPYGYTLSYVLLLYAGWRNRNLVGIQIALIGILMNFIVIASNGGRMPANLELVAKTSHNLAQRVDTGRFPRHQPLNENTRFPFLGDVLILENPYPRPCVFSLGDVFITLGGCWLILNAMGLLPEGFARNKEEDPTGESTNENHPEAKS